MALNEVRIKSCVQDIVKTDLEIHAMIQDLKEKCRSLSELEDVNVSVRAHTQLMKKKIDELERIAKEQDKEEDKQGLMEEASKYRKQYASTQTAVKKANLSCMFAINNQDRSELMGSDDPELRKRANRENLAKTASSITENLQSLNRMMAATVVRSELTNQVLENSSDTIASTKDEFKNMTGVIQSSRNLLTKYNRRELTDRLLIFLALALFLATVLYILKKRLF